MEYRRDARADEDNESVLSDDDVDGEDPCTIQIELDILNSASDNINKLETELEKARGKFRKVKSEASSRLSQVKKTIGKRCVRASEPYYDLQKLLHQMQTEAQKAATRYQDAYTAYANAKAAVREAELQLPVKNGSTSVLVDSVCQDILNRATIVLSNAEKAKTKCEQDHLFKTLQCEEYQKQMVLLLKQTSQAITKAKPFYDLKDVLEAKIQVEKQNAEDLQLAIVCNKQKYKLALNNLEQLSETVHARRKSRFTLPPRTPGVGAEAESEISELFSSALDILSDNTSHSSLDVYDDRPCSSHDLCTDEVQEQSLAIAEHSGSRRQEDVGFETKHANVTDTLCREDLLEGAETMNTGVTSEFLNPDDVKMPCSREAFPEDSSRRDDGRSKNHAPVDENGFTGVPFVPEGVIPIQKRTVSVRELSKGIYVTSSVGSDGSKDVGAVNNIAALSLKCVETGSRAGKGKQMKVIQQFPLLQGLGFNSTFLNRPK